VKYCKTCGINKNKSEFHKRKTTKDGLQYKCKPCAIKAVLTYRQTEAGKEIHNRASYKYYRTKKGKTVHDKAQKKWVSSEKGKQYIRDASRPRMYKRYKADPEYYKLKCRAWHAGVPLGVLKQVLERDKVCQLCSTSKDLQFDHIYPVSQGGKGSLENLQLLCGKCNNFKSNHLFLPDGGMLVVGKQQTL